MLIRGEALIRGRYLFQFEYPKLRQLFEARRLLEEIRYIHSSPSLLRTRGIGAAVFYGTLCNTGIFRTRGKFRTLPNIYYEEFYSEPCVTLAYLKPWHIQNPRRIHNTVKHLLLNILFKTLCNPDIFGALVYSQLWYILKSKHIQSPAKYLRWSILLNTLCNYSIFRRPIYSKLSLIQNPIVSVTLYQLFFGTTNLLLLLYSLLLLKVFFQPVFMSYRALNKASHCRYLKEYWIWFTS